VFASDPHDTLCFWETVDKTNKSENIDVWLRSLMMKCDRKPEREREREKKKKELLGGGFSFG
jgi:hypothetical protein